MKMRVADMERMSDLQIAAEIVREAAEKLHNKKNYKYNRLMRVACTLYEMDSRRVCIDKVSDGRC